MQNVAQISNSVARVHVRRMSFFFFCSNSPEQHVTRSHVNVLSLQEVLHHFPACQCLAAAVHIPLAQPPYLKHVIFVYIIPHKLRMNESRKHRYMTHGMQFCGHIEQLSL